jgi:hypothetical protein
MGATRANIGGAEIAEKKNKMVFNYNYYRLYRSEKKNRSTIFELRSAKNLIAPPSCAYACTRIICWW